MSDVEYSSSTKEAMLVRLLSVASKVVSEGEFGKESVFGCALNTQLARFGLKIMASQEARVFGVKYTDELPKPWIAKINEVGLYDVTARGQVVASNVIQTQVAKLITNANMQEVFS